MSTLSASPHSIRDPWRRAWQTLSGDRWLSVLLLALATLLIVATLLPQTPQNDPVAYSRWLSEAQQRFGSLTTPLISLGLFSVTQSIGFRLLAALLALSAALRLIDAIGQWRASRALPPRPAAPRFDQVAEMDRDTAQAQLRGFVFRVDDELILAERHQRRSIIAAVVMNAGILIVLLGLVLAAVADTRTNNVVVEPGTVMTLPGTSRALRLDALTNGRATLTVLNEGQSVAQGELVDRQPLPADGLTIYLRNTGPALIVTAKRGDQALGLQSAVDSPPQPQKFLSFTPDHGEVFVAAPDAGVVLQLTWLSPDRYTAQALQMATGKVLASREIGPSDTLSVNAVTFAFDRAAFIMVDVVQQPAHWVIIPGWIMINLGVLALLLWPRSQVWLETQGETVRLMSDEIPRDRAVLTLAGIQPMSRLRPTIARVAAMIWLVWTAALIVIAIQIYPRAASLESVGFKPTAWLAAWLLLTGSVIVRGRWSRVSLLIVGVLSGAVAVGLGLI